VALTVLLVQVNAKYVLKVIIVLTVLQHKHNALVAHIVSQDLVFVKHVPLAIIVPFAPHLQLFVLEVPSVLVHRVNVQPVLQVMLAVKDHLHL